MRKIERPAEESVAAPSTHGSMYVVDRAQELANGATGSGVVEKLRDHYGTQCTVDKMVSNVRTELLEILRRRPRRPALTDALRRVTREAENSGSAACAERARQFVQMTPKEQYDAVRFHRGRRPFCDDQAVNAAVADVQVLPDNAASLRLTTDEGVECREQQKMALVLKSANVVNIPDAVALHKTMIDMMKTSTSAAKIALGLLFVSGRRSTEILNLRSAFAPVPNRPYLTAFRGQLKKRDEQASGRVYVIPLLCKYDEFVAGLETLRATKRQRDIAQSRSEKGEAEYTNKQVAKVYTSQLHYAQKKHLPFLRKTHELRSLYVHFVDAMFDHTLAMPLLCQITLGHDDMGESVHYSSISIDAASQLKRGRLYNEEFPQFRSLIEHAERATTTDKRARDEPPGAKRLDRKRDARVA
tara:strand:+ start:945 stop:2189 length:1245 start_codon:yes stop_codon:yes gene_type:complete